MIKKYRSFEEVEKDLSFSPKTIKDLEKMYSVFEVYENFFKIKKDTGSQKKRIECFKTFEEFLKKQNDEENLT